jgi:ubiquinone/menaquinone biosynthesis C-methylase UbiE
MDFTRPSGWFFSPFYDFYISKILPALGVVISMHWNEIFVYLAASIRRSRSPEQIAALMYSVGLRDIFLKKMTHGTTAFVSGEKAATQERASVEVTSPG